MVTVTRLDPQKDLNYFEKIPERIHRNHPWYTPPFPGTLKKQIGPKSPFHKKGNITPIVAYKNGVPVGRIAAIENLAFLEHTKEKTGFFGFFDSIDDPDVSHLLLSEAEAELRRKCIEKIRGPYSPSIHDECGILVNGFESPPTVMMPYNPPYYEQLLLQGGFHPKTDLLAFFFNAKTQPPEKISKICERAKDRLGIKIRTINMKELHSDLKAINTLYNLTLDRNPDFYPLDFEDVEYAASDLKTIVDPSMVFIAEKDGVPIGYSLSIPNINEFLWRSRNSNRIWRFFKVAFSLMVKKPSTTRLAALGVLPEYRSKGIAPLFYYETFIKGRVQYLGAELSWCEASNKDILGGIETMGGKHTKTYRIYEKTI